ncbi:DUF748 domain-containing protein [Comamonas piscis]|uniref:DUF748 domain-containing protein n=1 Tax=Comamonas piscis TaxID=1562974 RepID=A0A7G5EJX9_9BURK|nr:DUF748 domain-containing protein [Comamonas piscis]QMV74304.1 DUF748 domain-containing protein [Comamonas piscis]WSO32750.1 DUF748 domain-containing protein [Comamonas piscis]
MRETQETNKKKSVVLRWLRRLGWCLLALLLLWALSWLLLPWLLRTQGEKLGTEKLGRAVHIGAVEFRPWSLELTVRDLQIAGTQPDSPAMLAVERIYIDADMQSVFRLAPVLDAIQVDKPVLHLAQTAPGQFDFDDVLQKLRSPQPTPDDGKTAHFALYNIELKGGQLAFRDDTVGQTHALNDLQLGIPFLSNLESKREIKVLPQLAFVLNGSQFASHAEATPFADDRKAEAKFAIKDLDLKPYLAYIPTSLPIKLAAGVLNADLALAFEQQEKTQVRLSGDLHATDVQLRDAANGELLGWERLDVQLADVQPLLGQVHIAQLALDGAQLSLKRGKNGRLSLLDAQGQALPGRAEEGTQSDKAESQPAPSEAPAEAASTASSSKPAWSVQVDALKLSRLKGVWVDESVPLPARVQLDDFSMEAQHIAWPFKDPFSFEGSSGLSGAQGVPSTGRLVFSGKATDQMAEVDVSTTGLPLQLGASYLTGVIEPGLLGTIDSEMHLSRQGTALKVALAQMRVSDVALQCNSKANCAPPHGPAIGLKGKNNLLELRQLLVKDAVLDTEAQQVKLGSVQLVEPVLGVSRAKDGRMMFEDWLVASQARKADDESKPAASKPWDVQLDLIAIKGAQLAFQDESTARKVAFRLTGWDVELRDYAPLARKAKPSPLKLSGRIGSGRAEPGRVAYDGSLGLAPLAAAGRVNLSQLPVHAFVPYAEAMLPVRLVRADANFRGTVDYAQSDKGPVLRVKGDAGLDDVRVRPLVAAAAPSRSDDDASGASDTGRKAAAAAASGRSGPLGLGLMGAGDDLLNWKLLSLRALVVDMVPGQRMKVQVGETALSDFYARLLVQENGKLNLQDLGGSRDAAASDPAAPAEGVVVEASGAAAVSPPASPASPEPATGPIIDMGPITLAGGNVKFSDQFVRPNYSADLSELAGRMGAFSSEPTAGQLQLAELELRGKAEGTASLEITGQLNPLVKPLALNIHGKVRDLELSPLTPYSIKYAGHGIERGKMSVDVQYDVTPEGMLTASNKLVLNQLTFGDAVEGAPASLPVKLAVALLADRNGVIDLDLPISGSLNDPQFRLAPIIFKVIGNLIMKAVTSPFALLSGAFGGGSEASHVPFGPGSAMLDAASKESLDKVAKALEDRPALQLTVAGQADLEREKDGWRKARINDLVLAQKRRATVRAGGKPEDVQQVSAAEYPALLKDVYKRADIQKPRNMVGMATDIPTAEMETLLLTSISVPDNAMRELALARGVTVRDYLASKGIKLERLFLGNAKTEGFGEVKDWAPHAELSLAPR